METAIVPNATRNVLGHVFNKFLFFTEYRRVCRKFRRCGRRLLVPGLFTHHLPPLFCFAIHRRKDSKTKCCTLSETAQSGKQKEMGTAESHAPSPTDESIIRTNRDIYFPLASFSMVALMICFNSCSL
jgi:hypothetical protein